MTQLAQVDWPIWLKHTCTHLCSEVSECHHSVTQTIKQHLHFQLILVCPSPVIYVFKLDIVDEQCQTFSVRGFVFYWVNLIREEEK